MSVKSTLIQTILAAADLAGVNRLFRRLNRGKVRVLMYHGVSPARTPTPYWTLLAVDKFRWQMQYLRRHCAVRPATYLLEGRGRAETPACPVVITFDDGLENTYSEAWPVLREAGLTAICFVLPGLSASNDIVWTDKLYACFMAAAEPEIDLSEFELGILRIAGSPEMRAQQHSQLVRKLKRWPHERRRRLLDHLFAACTENLAELARPFRLMTREQISELGRSPEFQIGGHTSHHVILSTLETEEQEAEIRSSLEKVEQWCENNVPIFCYPNGQSQDYDDTTIAILRRLGIEAALSTHGGFHSDSDDMYRIKRVPIGADITRAEFKARLSGLYQFLTNATGRQYS